jgi:ELWxxDGT repeat protein
MKKPILFITLIIAVVLPAFSQRVLKDIAQGTDNAWIFSGGSFSSGDTLYFSADTVSGEGFNYKYYRTVGSTNSTKELVHDEQSRLTYLGNRTQYHKYKNAIYGINNNHLLKIQNDSIKYIQNLYYRICFAFFELNNQLYLFSYEVLNQTFELWIINADNTAILTKTIYQSNPMTGGSISSGFFLDNKFYYPFYNNSISGITLFCSDGTANGTKLIQNNRFTDNNYQTFGSSVYFAKQDLGPFWYRSKLWKSKGDSLSTEKIIHSIDGDTTYGAYNLFKFNSNLYFASLANDQVRISKLDTTTLEITHISSGFNAVGSLLVTNDKIIYASGSNGILNFYENNGNLSSERIIFSIPELQSSTGFIMAGTTNIYFGEQKLGNNGYEGDVIYWIYDGTTVKKLTDLKPDIVTGVFENAVGVAGNIFYFSASDNQHGYELWRTDGTSSGTYMMKDINKKSASSFAKPLFDLGNFMYFMADDISHGNEIWRTNGTTAGLYADLGDIAGSSHVLSSSYRYHIKYRDSYIADINTKFYQFAHDGNMKDLSFLPMYYFSVPHEYKNLLFFMGNDGNLWSTDCTIQGTKKAVHLDSTGNGSGNWGINDLVKVDSLLLFTSNNGTILWKTNGKKNGTTKLFTFTTGNPTGFQHNYLTSWVADKKIYFLRLVEPNTPKTELWVSNTTTSGTIKLLESTSFFVLGTLSDKLYFIYNESLWQSDGTFGGTFQLDSRSFSSAIKLRDKLYLLKVNLNGLEYYELDKNNQIHLLHNIPTSDNNNNIGFSGFYKIDERFILNVIYNETTKQQHFYITDGNKENVKKAFVLKNSVPYTGDYNFLYHNKKVYFTAVDSLKGQELWIWDFDCPDGYTIRDNITKDSTIVYGKNIWGQNIVSNNKTVTYDAKNSITLQPGFEAQKGTVFKTKLIGCANNTTTNVIEEINTVKNEPLVRADIKTSYPQLFDFLYYYPNKSIKEIYEQAVRNKLVPVNWDVITEKDIYRLDLKIGSSVFKAFLPKKNQK